MLSAMGVSLDAFGRFIIEVALPNIARDLSLALAPAGLLAATHEKGQRTDRVRRMLPCLEEEPVRSSREVAPILRSVAQETGQHDIALA